MESTQIIIKPVITEKSTWESQQRNRYSFHVHQRADKRMIRRAIEHIYKVRVARVATQNKVGRFRRTRFGLSRTPNWKKAVVELHPDDRIDLF